MANASLRDLKSQTRAKSQKVLVLISGREASGAARRAGVLLSHLDCPVIFRYRTSHRIWSLLQFVWTGIAQRPTVIYAVDTVWSAVIAALVLKVAHRCRFVLDTGASAYALARSMGRRSFPARLAVWLVERTAIRVADLVVVRGSYYRSFLRYERVKRVLEIPDCVAVSTFTNDSMLDSQAREIRCSLGLQDVLVMGMVGSCEWNSKLGIAHGWEFIEAMQHLHGLPIHGIIIGDGDGIPRLRSRIAELGLETRVSLLGSIQREAIGPYVRMMDICLSTQPDDRIGWARTTDELVLYLVNNRFILASNVGQAACVLPPEMRVTYVGTVDREYPKRLAERVREIIREPQLLALGSRGRDVVRAQFDASRWRTRLAACLGLPLREIQAADV